MQHLEGSGVPLLYIGCTVLNPLNPELNPICYLLALLGAHHFLHVSRIRVKGSRPSPYRAVNTFHFGYKNQSVYAVSGTSRCLFSDKYKTHKYSLDSMYNCWMLNCWCITQPVGFKRLRISYLMFEKISGKDMSRHLSTVKYNYFIALLHQTPFRFPFSGNARTEEVLPKQNSMESSSIIH